MSKTRLEAFSDGVLAICWNKHHHHMLHAAHRAGAIVPPGVMR